MIEETHPLVATEANGVTQIVFPSSELPCYRILERIGNGGAGVVYRVVRKGDPDSIVALKLLTSENLVCVSPARLLALDHPHLVRIRDCGHLSGRFFLEMEYLREGTLRQRLLHAIPWSLSATIGVIEPLGSALSYLHAQELLHLDLKPENALWNSGLIQLADLEGVVPFGVSPTHRQGSPDYCSPEQRFGLAIDQRSDLFSLAVVTYELITGHLPGRAYCPLKLHVPQLPSEIDDVLRRALSRNPEVRQSSVALFVQEFREALVPLSSSHSPLLPGHG
jgi:serine/threonine protein kinase